MARETNNQVEVALWKALNIPKNDIVWDSHACRPSTSKRNRPPFLHIATDLHQFQLVLQRA